MSPLYPAVAAINLAVNLTCVNCDCLEMATVKTARLQTIQLDEPPTILSLRDERCDRCDWHAVVHIRLDGVTYYLDNGHIGRTPLTKLPSWWVVTKIQEAS